jgi:hypothetical protein
VAAQQRRMQEFRSKNIALKTLRMSGAEITCQSLARKRSVIPAQTVRMLTIMLAQEY